VGRQVGTRYVARSAHHNCCNAPFSKWRHLHGPVGARRLYKEQDWVSGPLGHRVIGFIWWPCGETQALSEEYGNGEAPPVVFLVYLFLSLRSCCSTGSVTVTVIPSNALPLRHTSSNTGPDGHIDIPASPDTGISMRR
jgi:hypothetical protein